MSLFLVWPLLLTYWFFPNPALLCRKKGYWVFELLTYHYCTCILKGEGSPFRRWLSDWQYDWNCLRTFHFKCSEPRISVWSKGRRCEIARMAPSWWSICAWNVLSYGLLCFGQEGEIEGETRNVSPIPVKNWVLPVPLLTSLNSAGRFFLLLLHQTNPKGSFPSSQSFACLRNHKSRAAVYWKQRKTALDEKNFTKTALILQN